MTDAQPTALFIYGLPGAGKSTVLDAAADHGIPSITMGDVVRKRAREALGDDLNSDDIGEWATRQREQHGPTIMAEYTREELLATDPSLAIVEGTRSLDEIRVFEQDFETMTLRVDAPFSARLQRLQDRGRDGEASFTATDLQARDAREFTWGLGELFAADSPDFVIQNDGTLADYRAAVDDVFAALGVETVGE